MATLYVRDFPDELHQRVKKLASHRRRSLSAEAIYLIEQALRQEASREASLEALDRITERRRSYKGPRPSVDSVTLLREDRNR